MVPFFGITLMNVLIERGWSMSQSICIADQELSVIEYHGQRVLTFTQIDRVHQRSEGAARKRFNDNKARFLLDLDFYVVDSKSMSVFRTDGIFGKSAQHGMLITESGYLMLVKSFTDDLAWQVQRELVNVYFRAKAELTQANTGNRFRLKFPHLLHGFYRGATLSRITRMERELVGQGVHEFDLDPEQARTRALGIIQKNFGADPAFLFQGLPIIVPDKKGGKKVRSEQKMIENPAVQEAPVHGMQEMQKVQETIQVDHNLYGSAPVLGFTPYLTATQMAEQLNLRFSTSRPNGHAVNDLLCAMGLAYRLADNRILPTPEGEKVCHRRPALDAQNRPLKDYETLTWDARIVDRLRHFVKNNPSQTPLF